MVEVRTAQPSYPGSIICYHCQQYTEKLLKALLTAHSIEAPRTHNLRRLIELASPYVPELATLSDRADLLTNYATQSRYPNNWRVIEASEVEVMVALGREFAASLFHN